MSTRCTIHFHDGAGERAGSSPEAIIYRHSDGYPEAVEPDLAEFFKAVEAQTSDTRFTSPDFLAARFVVWESQTKRKARDERRREIGYGSPSGGELDFLGVGVCQEDPGDIEYRYHVWCGYAVRGQHPHVTHEEV